MFSWFGKKKVVEKVREDTKKGFDSVKSDISNLSVWIKHLENEDSSIKQDILDIKDVLTSLQEEFEGLKNVLDLTIKQPSKRLFKTNSSVFAKQTAVEAVQTLDQTGVQTPNLEAFSVTERAIIWVLLNYEGKLSYEDLAVMLGKERSTVRGQINSIRDKSEGLIEEVVEKNGKKRVYIPEEVKEKLLKKTKGGVKSKKRG